MAWIILVLVLADYLSKGNPARQLLLFSASGITRLNLCAWLADGMMSVYAFIQCGIVLL
ncbi:MAG UNVERIFIED_CONTAM: hypothetical protein LVR18_13505 [Planctomycetaceae bacterium]|jgi:FHS family L-fucose permease-like MFS transporter